MSMLNQLFNRGLLGARCKTCLTLAIARIKLLQNKRDSNVKQMRKEIAQFLQTGQEAIARIRVEHVVREQNVWAAYEILELFCEFILARVPIMESQKECPPELREAISSIIFAAPRCSDLPDLLQIKNMFSAKYGKEFAMAASELRPDTSVNRALIETLSISPPSGEIKLKMLKEIAHDYGVDWDCSNTEAELRKKHEDLLLPTMDDSQNVILCGISSYLIQDGSKQICEAATISQAPTKQRSIQSSPSNGVPVQPSQSSATAYIPTFSSSHGNEPSLNVYNGGSTYDTKTVLRSQSSDVLEKARVAIETATRATAAARAAAELVNVKYGSWNQNNGQISKC